MSSRSFLLSDGLDQYITQNWVREPAVLGKLREETQRMPEGGMQIGADQGQFFSVLIKALGVKRCLEVGVFTGYSSTVVALALPEDGRIVACDVSEEFTSMARRYWKEAGVEHKISLRLGPGLETLDALVAAGEQFDFCFIDADKPIYLAYYERALKLVRSNGLIAIDNVLWGGQILDRSNTEESTEAIRQVNEFIGNDPRVECCLLPIGDGVTLARVK